jgi:hypothetical protein
VEGAKELKAMSDFSAVVDTMKSMSEEIIALRALLNPEAKP